jgi:hypothetical protein
LPKGSYTEDYTVIGEGSLDANGVVRIEMQSGVKVNPSFPLSIGIKNSSKWTYYTTDWRGLVPDFGVNFNSTERTWDEYPSDPASYDYALDVVSWMHTDIDLRMKNATTFMNASGFSVEGFEIEISGVKALQRDHLTYFISDMDCAMSGTQLFPKNDANHKFKLVSKVPSDFDLSDWNSRYYSLTTMYQCFQTNETFACRDGDSGTAYKMYVPEDWYAYSTPVTTYGSPCILTDRSGRNHSFAASGQAIEVDNEYRCSWTWMEFLGGWIATNFDPCETRWSDTACEPGFAVESGACDLTIVRCDTATAEAGEHMNYEMVDLCGDDI